jgi:diaminohydroxyphosphoribosylaminopyrimidine deaminase / 5-amino-6-(5-phosphoribosylamino)uracil reductase
MSPAENDLRHMRHALALAERTAGVTIPNPGVGCIIVRNSRVVGRGWTQAGGRPHGEFKALAQAGTAARGATVYTTLEPCAHASGRGPACSDHLVAAGVGRVVIAMADPDPRTAGQGITRLEAAGIAVTVGPCAAEVRHQLRAFRMRLASSRPWVTAKMAVTLDGFMAESGGTSRWITGPDARAHAHLVRSRMDALIVGSGTWERDAPQLDVRLPGLEDRSPLAIVLSTRLQTADVAGKNIRLAAAPYRQPFLAGLAAEGMLNVMVEGGPQTVGCFLRDDLVDEIHLYRAPVLLGGGRHMSAMLTEQKLASAHGIWHIHDTRRLGTDDLTVYLRNRES